jgi:hypothetical protein
MDHLRDFFAAEIAARLAAGELAFDIRQILQLAGRQLELTAQRNFLLTQRLQLRIA